MRVALCVKEVLDTTGPLSLIEETKSLARFGLVPVVNPADLSALMLVRNALPANVATITAISLGPKSAERALRTCLALGADVGMRVWDSALEGSECGGNLAARVLASVVMKFGFDLVVCGSKGLCGASGYVGPALAEYLNFAQICSVSHLQISDAQDIVTMHRRLDHGDREIVSCRLPMVITVDEGVVDIPYASLPSVLAAERSKIQTLDFAALGLKSSDSKAVVPNAFLNYIPPRPRTKKALTPDASSSQAQRMLQAMGGGAAKKTGGPVEGEPKKVAGEIVRFLTANGLLAENSAKKLPVAVKAGKG